MFLVQVLWENRRFLSTAKKVVVEAFDQEEDIGSCVGGAGVRTKDNLPDPDLVC